MKEIFLSASVPVEGRGDYYETANPFLIQFAVRELIVATIQTMRIVWGGHPAITPMIWEICRDLNVDYSERVVLYQSRFFDLVFPDENRHFYKSTVFVDAIKDDREASLLSMRKQMLSRPDLCAAVFIGGMEGIEAEYDLFNQIHPSAKTLFVSAPGGATLELAKRFGFVDIARLHDVGFAQLFHSELLSLEGNSMSDDVKE